LPADAVHCVGHWMNMALLCAAAAMAARIPGPFGVLWAAAALVEPILRVQGVSLGQEPFLVLCTMGVLYGAMREKTSMVMGFLIAGMLVNPLMVIPAFAMVLYWSADSVCRRKKEWGRICGAGLITLFGIALLLMDSDGAGDGKTMSLLLQRIREHFCNYLPLPGAMTVLALAGTVILWVRRRCWSRRMRGVVLCFLIVCGFWAAYFLYSVPLPRYSAMIVLPLFCWCGLLVPWTRRGWMLTAVGVAGVAGVLLHSGDCYPQLPGQWQHSGEFQERSLEFLRQMKMDQELCRYLEATAQNRPVVAKWPYVQMLAEPRYGYVQKALPDVRCAGIVPVELEKVKKYPGKRLQNPENAVYIFVCNTFEFFAEFGPPLMPPPGARFLWAGQGRSGKPSPFFTVYER
ncbi:MAG: hypothetical protein J6R85_02165, partial [Lentisphaeria bacterium]|nr:hypothetical protein [Lentisphaeria bacterium]